MDERGQPSSCEEDNQRENVPPVCDPDATGGGVAEGPTVTTETGRETDRAMSERGAQGRQQPYSQEGPEPDQDPAIARP